MTFSITTDTDPIVLKIEGELDAVTVPELRAPIERLVESRPGRVVVDLSNLRVIDSSGWGRWSRCTSGSGPRGDMCR